MSATENDALDLLFELTDLPTAAGREHRVIRRIKKWVEERPDLQLRTDEHGNLILTRAASETISRNRPPVFLTAHLDHPAFVLRRLLDGNRAELEFRGGVRDHCFPGKEIEIFDEADRVCHGKIVALDKQDPFRIVVAELSESSAQLQPGDVGRWRLSGIGAKPGIKDGLFYAPACDDLAGVVAALTVLDRLRKNEDASHVGVLLTRAEEIGFVGAIGAAKSQTLPKNSRLICLEMSRSFPESPIGAGPVLRVGDFTGVFSPNLTNRFTLILREHEQQNPGFRWQRKLMPGGTCEATVFSEFGYETTCFCLPLGNYHNMTDASLAEGEPETGGIGPEFISVDDYLRLLDLLAICVSRIDSETASHRQKLETRFERGKHVLKKQR